MSILKQVLDPYDRRARLFPAFVVLLPLGLAFIPWFSVEFEIISTLGGFAIALGLTAFLAQLARDIGKGKETKLFQLWGGKPSVIALSYRFGKSNPTTLARCHSKLKQLDPNLPLPESREDELSNPAAADIAYESANDLILAHTRDHKLFPLLFEENINYGYRRNLWGMKPAGIFTSIIGLIAGTIRFIQICERSGDWNLQATLVILICTTLFVLWVLRITPKWVKLAGEAYAKQVINACERL